LAIYINLFYSSYSQIDADVVIVPSNTVG